MPNQTPLEIVPGDAALGAEVRGVDLAIGMSAEQIRQLKTAWDEHLVLVFRGQQLTDSQLLDFSRLFGELDPPGPNPYGEPFHKEFPEINVISNIVENSQPRGNLGSGEAVWHADMTYLEQPPKAGILYALEIPAQGGDTCFANMFAAYDALPETLKLQIDGRRAIHDASHNSAGMRRKGYDETTDVSKTPGARQPLARTDRLSGRKALFLGRRPRSYVIGMALAESEALLDTLWAHATEPRFAMAHVWQPGDLLMWNNLAVLHRRDAFDPTSRRRLHRTQLKGDALIS